MAGNIQDVQEALSQAVSKTLEELSFSEVKAEGVDVIGHLNSDMYFASVNVEKPCEGAVALYMPKDLAKSLTTSTYGMDSSELEDNMIHDTMGEFVNTIAGCALTDILNPDQIFMLSIPECSLKSPPTTNKEYEWLPFSIEGKVFVVMFHGKVFLG